MNYTSIIIKVITYIEDNLSEDLDLKTLSQITGLSEYHFHRTFRAVTGESLIHYIKRRRITQAAFELLETDKPIVDIAMDQGYESQSTFTRFFSKTFKTSPAQYRKENINKIHLIKTRLNSSNLSDKSEKNTMPFRIEKIAELHLRGQEFYTSLDEDIAESTVYKKWLELAKSIKEKNPICSLPQHAYMINTDYEFKERENKIIDESWKCYIGFEDNCFTGFHTGFRKRTVVEDYYIIFTHRGEIDKLRKTYIKIWAEWLPVIDVTVESSKLIERHNPQTIASLFDSTQSNSSQNVLYTSDFNCEICLKLLNT
jgi:AraC family transcriptional regulator